MLSKWKSANRVVWSATMAAGGVGASPIPFSDTAALIAIQSGMIASINFAYGLPLSSSILNTLVTAIVGSGAFSFAGKQLVRIAFESMKALPYLNIVGSVLCGVVAGSSTLTMGSVYSTAVDRTIRGYPELLLMDSGDVESVIATNIYSVAKEKAKVDTKSLWKEVCEAKAT